MSQDPNTHLSNGFPIQSLNCLGFDGSVPTDDAIQRYKKCMCEVGVKWYCPEVGRKLSSTASPPRRSTTTTTAATTTTTVRSTTELPWWLFTTPRTSTTTTTTELPWWLPTTPRTSTTTTTTELPWWLPTTPRGQGRDDVYRPSSRGSSLGLVMGWAALGVLVLVALAAVCKMLRDRGAALEPGGGRPPRSSANRRRRRRASSSGLTGGFPEPTDVESAPAPAPAPAPARPTAPPPSAALPGDAPPPYELVAPPPPPYEHISQRGDKDMDSAGCFKSDERVCMLPGHGNGDLVRPKRDSGV